MEASDCLASDINLLEFELADRKSGTSPTGASRISVIGLCLDCCAGIFSDFGSMVPENSAGILKGLSLITDEPTLESMPADGVIFLVDTFVALIVDFEDDSSFTFSDLLGIR